ncbi:hypothetical protein MAHJHV28_00260 [Mycobacterium avium subsp. hominissuis]
MIGTDLGQEFDENFVLQAGMVLVLEPVVWEDGTGSSTSTIPACRTKFSSNSWPRSVPIIRSSGWQR